MKIRVILSLVCACLLISSAAQAQLFKQVKDRFRQLTGMPKDTFQLDEGPYETPGKPITAPSLIIGGDEKVQLDSVYEYDIAIYQETKTWKDTADPEVRQHITICYSSEKPQLAVNIEDNQNGARYQYFADFLHAAQLSMTAIHRIGSGEKEALKLDEVSPVYPGEWDFMEKLAKTGQQKEIEGILCDEFAADSLAMSDSTAPVSLVSAHIWLPATIHTLFGGYIHIPEPYHQQLADIQAAGGIVPVSLPLETLLTYSDGAVRATTTTAIVNGEPRRIAVSDIIRQEKPHS
ncbi:hypothetical protein [Chitinophaga sp. Cy-1792]|uniref:hypothetical protein n=1 Tax=Chitinophaga sp. Cy-1792 TaxID=2608339 RepID=UPI00141FCA3A|nr:hypothetical protein [Chitinophaga sp. Cy-1792]NIG53790.1 hypothetical protein [Chitinophaga sp. Cy-1792]